MLAMVIFKLKFLLFWGPTFFNRIQMLGFERKKQNRKWTWRPKCIQMRCKQIIDVTTALPGVAGWTICWIPKNPVSGAHPMDAERNATRGNEGVISPLRQFTLPYSLSYPVCLTVFLRGKQKWLWKAKLNVEFRGEGVHKILLFVSRKKGMHHIKRLETYLLFSYLCFG